MPTTTIEKFTSTLKPARIQAFNSDPGIVRIFKKNQTRSHIKYVSASSGKEVIIGSLTGNSDLGIIVTSGISFLNNPFVSGAIY